MKRAWPVVTAVALGLALAAGCIESSSSPSDGTTDVSTLGDGLVVHYPLDGDARDMGAGRHDGTVYGATATVDRRGGAGGAMAFDGIDDRIVVARRRFASGNVLSVSLWVNTTATGPTRYLVMCSDFGVFTGGGTVGMAISIPATSSAKGALSPGIWTHLAGTYDGSTIKAYVNGQLVDSLDWPGTLSDLGRDLTFGFFGGAHWNGVLDEVRIYNRLLTPDEVRQLHLL